MWGLVTKAKNLYGWFKFIWAVVWSALGWFGLTSIFSGLAVTAIGVTGAFFSALPWPFVLMAGYCTLVGMVYLSMAPLAFKVLIAARDSIKTNATEPLAPTQPAKQLIAPHYEAWKHVEKFTLVEAAYLWNDLEPKAKGNYTTEVQAWVDAFCAAIRTGALNFISAKPNDPGYIRLEKAAPDRHTKVSRTDLSDFAMKNNYKPKFLSRHNHLS